jgi:hypothetical protein
MWSRSQGNGEQDFIGDTVLHKVVGKNAKIFKYLIENGADVHSKNYNEYTPYDLLISRKSEEDFEVWEALIEDGYIIKYEKELFVGNEDIDLPYFHFSCGYSSDTAGMANDMYRNVYSESKILCTLKMLFHKFIYLDFGNYLDLIEMFFDVFEKHEYGCGYEFDDFGCDDTCGDDEDADTNDE